jgi:hypothetical protein
MGWRALWGLIWARTAELSEGLGLDLPNPLTRHRRLLADFLYRVVAAAAAAPVRTTV